MKKLLIIIEKTKTGYSAYAPDLAGCVATGATKGQVKKNIKEAIEFHLAGLKEEGGPIPPFYSESDYIPIAV